MGDGTKRREKGGARIALVVPRTPPMTSRPGLAGLWASSPRLRASVFHAPLPSLSLLALAGHTPGSVQMRYLDENFRALPREVDCDIAAVTAITCQAPRAYGLASRLRRRGAHVVLGGVHPTILPAEAAKHADTVITGEAGGLWEQFLGDWLEGRPKRLYRPGEGRACAADASPGYGLLHPARHRTVPVQLGSGCPWGCDYCSVAAVHGGRYRRRKLSRVLEEVRFIKRRWRGSPLRLFFVDDRLRFRGEFMGRLMEELGSLGAEWTAQADTAALSGDALLRRLARAGCRRLLVAVDPEERGPGDSRSALERWAASLNRCGETLRRVRRHGMDLSVMFMLGRDGDGPPLFRLLHGFLRDAGVSDVLAAIQTPLPGTPLYRRLRRQGRLLPGHGWSEYNLFNVVYRPSHVSARRLAAAQTRLLKAVYGRRPRYPGAPRRGSMKRVK